MKARSLIIPPTAASSAAQVAHVRGACVNESNRLLCPSFASLHLTGPRQGQRLQMHAGHNATSCTSCRSRSAFLRRAEIAGTRILKRECEKGGLEIASNPPCCGFKAALIIIGCTRRKKQLSSKRSVTITCDWNILLDV